ncbi:MAG: NifU family protein [Candidatus Nanopelagicales bacterium]
MVNVAMHVEATTDPLVLRWIVRGGIVSGPAVLRSAGQADGSPPRWIDELDTGTVTEVVVGEGEVTVRARDVESLRMVAPGLQAALSAFLNEGNQIHCTTAARTDEELADAVNRLLDGPLQTCVASHGGKIELESVDAAVVTVRLIGACQGCASSGTTLREGIEEQLRASYPEVVAVRSIEGKSRTLDGRKLLPFIDSG